jgi:galactose oxidase
MGGAGNGATTFSDTNSVFAAEMWEPATGKFRTLASAVTPRNYHSFAVLLMDGRVLSGGGGLCGGWGCTVDHPDAEIFTPPYLLNADGTAATRPVLSAAPTTARPGTNITVSATGAASYALVRMSAVTHSVNNDQRRIPLRIASTASGTATLAIPASTGVVLPGNYMLFAMSSSGVPSQAKVINIQ